MVFSSILQNDGPKPKIFCENMETKHPLNFKGGHDLWSSADMIFLILKLIIVNMYSILELV